MLAANFTENWAKGKINEESHGPAEIQNLSFECGRIFYGWAEQKLVKELWEDTTWEDRLCISLSII